MVILGIDPGSQLFGLSWLEVDGNRARFQGSEQIRLAKGDLVDRMSFLIERLDAFLDSRCIDCAAIEEGFLGTNVKTVEVLARIRGLVMTLLLKRKIPFFTYPPRSVKLAISGYGHADKAQIKKALALLLGPEVSALSEDESDALAIAYCHFLKR